MSAIIAKAIDNGTKLDAKTPVDSMERGLLNALVNPNIDDHELIDTLYGISGDELARVRAES